MILWKTIVPLTIVHYDAQHVLIHVGSAFPFYLYVVYGANKVGERLELYHKLAGKLLYALHVGVVEHFNEILSPRDAFNQVRITSSIVDFGCWIDSNALTKHSYVGLVFT